jgi:hypothetical protein
MDEWMDGQELQEHREHQQHHMMHMMQYPISSVLYTEG